MSSYGTRANSKRNRTKSKKDNSKRDDYLRTQKESTSWHVTQSGETRSHHLRMGAALNKILN